VCFIVHKTTSELEFMILTTLYLAGVKNTGHLPNRVLTCHLSSLSLCIGFYSIENGRPPMGDVRRIQ
jgi:hypothetical protein